MRPAVPVLALTLLAGALTGEEPPPARPVPAPTPAPCPDGAAARRVYAVIMMGNRAGSLTACDVGGGAREERFAFNDRGRGPDLRVRRRFDSQGLPQSLDIAGLDYLKNEVEEHFALAGGRARWRNKAERGERAAGGFYVGYSAPPDEIADLARALLRAPGQRLALLPEGEARVDARGTREVAAGPRPHRLRHHAVSGLGFTPTDVWLDEQGPEFVVASRWLSIVPEGWEASLPDLLAAQEEDAAARDAEQARRLARRPAAAVAIHGARVFDPAAGTLSPASTVVFANGRITAVGPDGAVAVPEGAERIDAAGRVLIPGLWDMHVHVGPGDGLLHLAAGVTSVRDLANDPDALDALARRFDAGEAVGPRVFAAGIIDGPGPFQGPTRALAATEEDGRAWVHRYADRGYRQVKLYSSLDPRLVAPIAAEAHRLGLRVSGHVPAFMTAEQAVRAGYDEIQHMNMLFLNFFFEEVKDTRTPARFTAVAERAGGLDLGSPPVTAFIGLLRERKTVVDPTLAVFEQLFVDRPGVTAVGFAAVADRLPPQARRGLLDGGLPVPAGRDATYRASFEALLRMLRRLHEAGVPIVAGTDGLPGFQLHRELELYVRAGLTPSEVLTIATLGAARVAGRDGDLGSIAAGKRADLVLLAADPLQDISAVRRPALVVKDGVLYDPAALQRELGIRP